MKSNKIVLIIISAVLCLALIFGGIVILSGRNKKKNEKTDGQEKTKSTISAEVPKPDMSAESSKTEITDTGKGLKPDETEADKILQRAEQKKEVYTEPVLQGNEQKTKKYVRDADPETGISWDGESKIIYRTAEGLTTEKTYGGYYEIRPNEWVQLPYDIKEETVTDKCEHCGKVRGDGTNGTCIRYSLADGDMTCPNCGKAIPKHTCHTCGG